MLTFVRYYESYTKKKVKLAIVSLYQSLLHENRKKKTSPFRY